MTKPKKMNKKTKPRKRNKRVKVEDVGEVLRLIVRQTTDVDIAGKKCSRYILMGVLATESPISGVTEDVDAVYENTGGMIEWILNSSYNRPSKGVPGQNANQTLLRLTEV